MPPCSAAASVVTTAPPRPARHRTTSRAATPAMTATPPMPGHRRPVFDHSTVTGNCSQLSQRHRPPPASTADPHPDHRRVRGLSQHHHLGAGSAGSTMPPCSAAASVVTTAPPPPARRPDHIPSGNTCDDCHTTNAWTPGVFDHSTVTGNCSQLPQRHLRHRQAHRPHPDHRRVRGLSQHHHLGAGSAGRPCRRARHLLQLSQRHHRHRQDPGSHPERHHLR